MKKLSITIIILLTITIHAESQITFTYDDAGNRIHRQTVVLKNISEDDIETKVKEISENFGDGQIIIYPNPVAKNLKIRLSDITIDQTYYLELYNISGTFIKKQKINDTETILQTKKYPAGIYFLKIYGNNKNKQFKIIKR